MGGFCPGDFVQGDFVQGILSGGVLSGGFCPGGFCPRTIYPHRYILTLMSGDHRLRFLYAPHRWVAPKIFLGSTLPPPARKQEILDRTLYVLVEPTWI